MNFEIIKNTKEFVLLEVIFEDAIDKMSNKGFTGNEKYIKYTKGENNAITVYDKDSNVLSNFRFGESGSSLISDELRTLKEKVYRFILSQHIQPTKLSDSFETDLKVMPPKKGLGVPGHYCVHLGGEYAIFLKTEEEIKNIFGEYKVYQTTVAPTGVTVQEAKLA